MDAYFDPEAFVAFVDYAAAFFAAGFGLSLAFWLVGHSALSLLFTIKEV